MGNYSDFGHVVEGLGRLADTVAGMKERVSYSAGISPTSQDARLVALDGIQSDLIACGFWMNGLIGLKQFCKERFGQDWEREYLALIRVGPGFPPGPNRTGRVEDIMLDYLRNTLTTKVHFKVESLFANLLRELGVTTKKGFWNISDSMLKAAGLPVRGNEKDVLTALANLRNSYHSNGIHNGDTLKLGIGGTTFEFRKGEPVHCASWTHILLLLNEHLKVLRAVIFSEKVSSLAYEVRDNFASANV